MHSLLGAFAADLEDALSCRSFSAEEIDIYLLYPKSCRSFSAEDARILGCFCGAFAARNLQDALSCRSFFVKERLIMGLFRGKWPVKIRTRATNYRALLRQEPYRIFPNQIHNASHGKYATTTYFYTRHTCMIDRYLVLIYTGHFPPKSRMISHFPQKSN